jgi:hypothetical protein
MVNHFPSLFKQKILIQLQVRLVLALVQTLLELDLTDLQAERCLKLTNEKFDEFDLVDFLVCL